MKLLPYLTLLPSAATATTKAPQRITHATLTTSANSVLSALSQDGLVSITSIPDFPRLKNSVMNHFAKCIANRDAAVSFPDGTVRRSYAYGSDLPSTDACRDFEESLNPFRSVVDSVLGMFASRLSSELGSSLMQPLLSGEHDEEWNNVDEVVSSGETLDHFHSYQKLNVEEGKTIEFHVDQGLMLAFTPGLMMDTSGVTGVSEGFYVRDVNGEDYELVFDGSDDLVIMLGDGVNQYINNRLKNKQIKALFATPHALKLKTHQDPSVSRVWFGRMVLPPQNAFVPTLNDQTTFGQVHSSMIDHFTTTNTPMVGIGCSQPSQTLSLHGTSLARNLAQECAEDELYCWFRCMPLEDHELTLTTCSERNLQLQCANPRDQVVPDGNMHGDFYPACTNSTAPVEDYPKIDQHDETCDDLWEEFMLSDEVYDHAVDLTVPNGPETTLMWSIVGEDTIKARLVHNNVFGWLAMGFADPEGKHNGMNGGQILLATPYGTENYSPVTGLDTTQEAMIGTYIIDPDNTAFRHWQDAITSEEALATVAAFETNDCSTSISFESSHINGQEFNISGTDEMIWAGNSNDHFMGYHGPFSRMRFTIDWTNGEVTPFVPETTESESHAETPAQTTVGIKDLADSINGKESDVEVKESGAAFNSVSFWISVFCAFFGIVV